MILQRLFFLLTFISITHQIKTSSCKFNPSWGKKNPSTAIIPTSKPLLLEKTSDSVEKKDKELKPDVEIKVMPLPPVTIVGFIPGDRDLHSSSGQHAFNQCILEKILRSSENHEDSFDTEMLNLKHHAKTQVNKFVYGNIEPLKKTAKNKEILWDPEHIFTPTIETHPAGYPALTGFHHDYLHTVEKSEVFEFRDKEEHAHGFYCANIAIDPSNPTSQFRKTFFPAHWTRKQVLGCILSSMKNVTSTPKIYNNGVATEYMFSTPIPQKEKSKATQLDTSLALGFRVFNIASKTSMTTAYPELPSK